MDSQVITRHYHFNTIRKHNCSGYVSCTNVELWTVVVVEWSVAATFFFFKDINLSFKFSVWSYRTFFADNHTTTDVGFFDTSQQDTYVISSFSSIKDFTEHLNTSNCRCQFFCTHTNDVNNITCISYTSFNTSCCNSTTTSNREYIFDRH